jgi:hypothetical protein
MVSQPKPKKSKQYFTKDTEDAIILYNQTEDVSVRNKIYEEHIKYPFDKLVENLIHTFKFYHFDVSYEDVKTEVIAFLNEKIHKYKPDNGKAFSYFSIVAKNYLIQHNNNNYKRFKNNDNIDVIDTNRNVITEVNRDEYMTDVKEFMEFFIKYMDQNLTVFFSKPADLAVADSIVELFRQRNNIEEFDKKALYILIRERARVKTTYITKVVKTVKMIYMKMYMQYLETGDPYIHPKKLM